MATGAKSHPEPGAGARASRYISLQVPKSVDLVKMSEKEIAEYAEKTAARLAESLPKDSTLLNTQGVSLSSRIGSDVTIWGAWSRSCGSAELADHGLRVNPEVFEAPMALAPLEGTSAKTVLETRKLGGKARTAKGK
jgi:hypothetical protein